MYCPTFEQFRELATQGNVVPVYRQVLGDVLTPVSAFSKIAAGPHAFLLESVVGGEKIGRYSFLGTDPFCIFKATRNRVTVERNGQSIEKEVENPLDELRDIISAYRTAPVPDLPRLSAGAVGYFAYDVVRYQENLPDAPPDTLGLPDIYLMFFNTMVIFDNIYKTCKVVHAPTLEGVSLRDAYDSALGKIHELCERLRVPSTLGLIDDIAPGGPVTLPYQSNVEKDYYMKVVEKCKEYIRAGDILQVVPSQRLKTTTRVDPFNIYRALWAINPSPYMFYLKMDDVRLIGSSPEVMVRVEDGNVMLRPIAGTRPRGKTEQEDRKLAEELLSDPKERAEHIMLVDLGRNDVGRVARYHTVKIEDCMVIERYSHVMHIVSSVVGKLAEGRDAFDTLRACLPAGTLSGAPKVRAMEIIDEVETERRGPYGGAVGYIDFSGNMDTCITIRTVVMKGQEAYVQAGGGIVADSVPLAEYEETLNKARGLLKAIEVAEESFRTNAGDASAGESRKRR
ncbi:MAG: anthranilate synthase [Planctomycetes bacterium SM23_65]|nr:MAG: anthranilate synthase [Planctomycetes bacterium SM23_65]